MTTIGGLDSATTLLMQFLRLPLDDASRARDILSRFLQGRESLPEGMPAVPLALGPNELLDVQDAQTLARRVLTAVAENLPIRTRDLAEIEGAAQQFDRRLGYTHAHITVTDVSGELALLTEAVLPQTVFLAHDGLPVQRLLADIFRELKYALGAHLAFRICPVCGILHRDDRYTPHICLGSPQRSAAEETSHLARPMPRTSADEIGAEVPEEETIYGVISDPASLIAPEVEPISVTWDHQAESALNTHGRIERHAMPAGVRYAPPQSSEVSDHVLSVAEAKPPPRAEGVTTPIKHPAPSANGEHPRKAVHHPGAAYWKDQP